MPDITGAAPLTSRPAIAKQLDKIRVQLVEGRGFTPDQAETWLDTPKGGVSLAWLIMMGEEEEIAGLVAAAVPVPPAKAAEVCWPHTVPEIAAAVQKERLSASRTLDTDTSSLSHRQGVPSQKQPSTCPAGHDRSGTEDRSWLGLARRFVGKVIRDVWG